MAQLMNLQNQNVAVRFIDSKEYCTKVPFHPPEKYPELASDEINPENHIYSGIRNLLFTLGMDRENFNTPQWNPFKDIIEPGMTVFLKPNTVVHEHEEGKDVFSAIVHASVLRPIIDYVLIALKGEGKIVIGDSQLIFSHFDKAMVVSQLKDLITWYSDKTSIPLTCSDLRIVKGVRTWLYGKWGRKLIVEDNEGFQFVDLGEKSNFKDIDPKRLRVAIANYKNMIKHHSDGHHQYMFPKSFLNSDVMISIPKLKTHRRTAVTLALKNFMGLPSWKDTLPHFITGSQEEGGDQYIYPSLRKKVGTRIHDEIQSNPYIPIKFMLAVLKKAMWNSSKIIPFKDDIFEGMWYGNDTLWRTLLDLTHIAFYADTNGIIRETPQRKFFCIIDGIIGGEKEGPLAPDPVKAGVFLGGFNPVTVDAVGATLMGFDIEKIPLIKKGFEDRKNQNPVSWGTPEDIRVIEGDKISTLNQYKKMRNLKFEAHPNWKGHVELS